VAVSHSLISCHAPEARTLPSGENAADKQRATSADVIVDALVLIVAAFLDRVIGVGLLMVVVSDVACLSPAMMARRSSGERSAGIVVFRTRSTAVCCRLLYVWYNGRWTRAGGARLLRNGPKGDRAIVRSAGDEPPIGRESHREQAVAVQQRSNHAPRLDVPQGRRGAPRDDHYPPIR